MRDFLINLFKDDVGGPAIEMYNWVHILFIAIIVGTTIGMYFLFKNKDEKTRKLVLTIYVITLVGLYLGDFFVHPFMENEDALLTDKLPFHMCTIACPLLAICYIFPNRTKHLKIPATLLGMIGAFYYIFIPSGVTGPDVMAFRYRTLQTFAYHGVLLGYGILSLLFAEIKLDIKKIWIDAIVLASIVIVAIGASYSYGHDWCFVKGTAFGIDPVAMPFVFFAVFIGTDAIVYGIYYLVNYLKNRKVSK